MSAIITTSQLVSALNEWGQDFTAAKVVQQNMSDLTPTADVFANLPIAKDVQITIGAKLKEAVVSSGREYDYPDVWRGMIETTWNQRDLQTFLLSWNTLTDANAGQPPYLILLLGLSRVDVTGAASTKRDYLLAGPCLLEPESQWKYLGNEIKAKFKVQPCATTYAGLSSADATALAALKVPPATTLSSGNFAMGAYGYMVSGNY